MIRQEERNLSPGIELETAHFLNDAEMYREYERLRKLNESSFSRVLRNPKFRRRLLQFTRLGLVGLIVWMGISMITEMGLWFKIYHAIVTAL